ncbi:MAG: PKD domain-containing protein [Acidimicrobiales bacterium]
MTRRRAAAALVSFVLAMALATAPASAATTKTIPLHLTGTSSKTIPMNVAALIPLDPVSQAALNVVCAFDPDCPNGLWFVGVDVDDIDVHVKLTQDVDIDATYTQGLLSEGKQLDVVDAVHPDSGTAKVSIDINGNAGSYVDGDPFDVDPFSKTIDIADVSCTVPAPGAPDATCELPPADLNILSLPMFPGISVDLAFRLDTDLVIDSTGLATVRDYTIVADSDTDPLSFSGSSLPDPFQVPCGPAGEDLLLGLNDSALAVDPSIPAALQLILKFSIAGAQVGDATVLKERPLGTVDFPAVELADAGPDAANLGTITPDSQAPVVTGVQSSYSGAEGSAIAFSATVQDACGAEDVVWKFSDGSTEYGTSVNKAFADNGSYSGNVTAVDARGNKTVKNFTVTVSNQAPVANAGLATVADWGRPVAFSGQATDPGSVDLGSLAYTWSFGDGSPSATGSKNAVHSYGAPGPYTAALNVTDKDGGTSAANRSVTVTKRDATLVYTGATSGQPNKNVLLSATLSDEYGQPVVGRKVTFNVGTQSIDAWTSSSGVASIQLKLTQKIGTYNVSATFLTDSHYNGSATISMAFKVGK